MLSFKGLQFDRLLSFILPAQIFMLTSPVSLHSLGELGFTRMLLDKRQRRSVRHVQSRCSGEDGGIFQCSYCNIHRCCLAPCVSAAGLCRASLGDFPILETGHPKSCPCRHLHIRNALGGCHLLPRPGSTFGGGRIK